MRTLPVVASFLLFASIAAGCADDPTSPAAGDASGSALTTETEVGACGTPLAPLTITPREGDGAGDDSELSPAVSAKGREDSVDVLVENGGVDCDGGEFEAKEATKGFIDVAIRFKRVNGEPSTTNCRCSPDVKGTIKDLPRGHYEVRVVRERMGEGGAVTEEVLTPTSIGVDVGG